MLDWRSHTAAVQVAGIVALAAVAACARDQPLVALAVFVVGVRAIWATR